MVIYSVDGIIHPLNNWVLQLIWPTVYRWIKPAANLLSNVCVHKSHKIKMEFGQKGPAEAGQQVVLIPTEEEFLIESSTIYHLYHL